jgi:hypothetical protein
MKPCFRNLFIKKLIRDLVVPTISASDCWLIFGMVAWGCLPFFPKSANTKSSRASRFSQELKS